MIKKSIEQQKKLIRWNDTATKLGISRQTLWRYSKEKDFPSKVTLLGRVSAFIESEIDAWIESRKTS